MIQWIKKHSYWALAIAVLIVAVVAVGAYAWNFRELSISTDTGKWADFATYLSGTVGVAAVVATLLAFVITLRQQQKLVDSQEKVVSLQKNELLKRDAYNIATVIFPKMRDHLNSLLDCVIADFIVFNDIALPNKNFGILLNTSVLSLFSDYERGANYVTFNEIFLSSDRGLDRDFVDFFLTDIRNCLEVIFECIDHAPELGFYLHDTRLKKVFSCCLCYDHAFNIYEKERFLKICAFLGIKPNCYSSSDIESKWYNLGLVLVNKKIG